MAERKNQVFEEWMRSQLFLAGEELIRRSETLSLGGLDTLQTMRITIDIPATGDYVEFPMMKFEFECLNKRAADDIADRANAQRMERRG